MQGNFLLLQNASQVKRVSFDSRIKQAIKFKLLMPKIRPAHALVFHSANFASTEMCVVCIEMLPVNTQTRVRGSVCCKFLLRVAPNRILMRACQKSYGRNLPLLFIARTSPGDCSLQRRFRTLALAANARSPVIYCSLFVFVCAFLISHAAI